VVSADGPAGRGWFASGRRENAIRDPTVAGDASSGAVLVAYATRHGSTADVAGEIAATLRIHGLHADVHPAGDVADLTGYDAVVIGGALYVGRLHAEARRFLKRHRTALATLPLAVFAMGPRTLEEADVAESRRQLERALEAVPELEPVSVTIFGGVVDPAKLRFPLNRMPAIDARDPEAIRAWARELADVLGDQVDARQ
jgi:menaquinone-dependent protoporphyrinogen oxidase